MRPNRGFQLLFAALVGVATYFLLLPEAGAVPSFSRKYQTSCQTCHTVYPALNPFGEAFRRDGYRFPSKDGSLDSDYEKAAAVELGQEQYKKLFPAAVWPDKILQAMPLSMWLNGSVAVNIPGSEAQAAAGNTFTWGGIEGEMHFFGAGAFNDNLTYMSQLTIDTEGGVDIETAYLLWNDIVGPAHLFNLWVGRLFAPQLTSYGLHSSYLGDTLMPGVSAGALYNPAATFVLGQGHNDGIELNGIAGHRFNYSLGWLASSNSSGLSMPNAEDVYAHVGFKIGGMSLDGEGAGASPKNAEKPWEETSIGLDVFGYHGITRLDNGTGATPTQQDDRFDALGGMIHAQVAGLVAVAGLQVEHHNRPYAGSPATPNPTGGVFNGVPNLASATAIVQYDELEYIIWPWFVPGVRAEYTHADVDGGPSAQLFRIIPGIALLPRPNIRVILSGDIEWARNLPPAGGWDGAGGMVAPTTAGQGLLQAEQITATVGVGF
ncbi:MAG TPA: hypothetical protein VLM85_31385 [Polyangiaceae bacterium]|nr:hypothetical protein [Polyangiaceae bacterium]